MNVKETYDQWSVSYDPCKNPTRDLDRIVTRKTLKDRHFSTILELGCGTGKNTQFYSQIGQIIHAVDFSEKMLAKAKEKLTHRNVTFSIADITRNWPFAERSADLITFNLVLEHIQDLDFIYSAAFRTLTDKGQLFISELHPFHQYMGKKANFEKDGQKFEIQAFTHHISDFINLAVQNGFALKSMQEWNDENQPDTLPRIIALIFAKPGH